MSDQPDLLPVQSPSKYPASTPAAAGRELNTQSRLSCCGCGGQAARLGLPGTPFLAELVADRMARIHQQAEALCQSAGTGTVAGNIAGALSAVFESVAVAIVGLIASRDELRVRLRQTTPTGVPLLTEAAAMIACYLTTEQQLGRIAADADVDTFAFTVIGAAHLLFAGRSGEPLEAEAVHKTVTTVVAGIRREPPR
jgi:hypothetical protein